jgi:hypothetical protein
MANVRNPTQWYPPSGKGYVIAPGLRFIIDNLSNFIIDNSSNFLVTTPTYIVPEYKTAWTVTGA